MRNVGLVALMFMENHEEASTSSANEVHRRPPGRIARGPRLVEVLGLWHRLRVEGTKYQRAVAIAAEQRGLVSRGQLLQAGLTYDVIRRLVARHFLIPVLPGVYAVGHMPRDVPLVPETAGLLAVRSSGWLSHQSAAAVWGLICMDDYTGPVHVTVAGGSAPRRRGVSVHRTSSLDPSDQRIHNDLPVTSPSRMLLDIAAESTDRELERAYDQVLVKRLARESDVRTALASANRHPGRKRLQSVVDTHAETTLTRSEAEERMLTLIRDSGLPHPAVNYRVHGFEVDFYWPRQRLVLEVDGFRYHSTPKAFDRDRERDTILRMNAISSMRVTWHQLDERPFEVVARLAWTLALAKPAGPELSTN